MNRNVLLLTLLLAISLNSACTNSESNNTNASPSPESPAAHAAKSEADFQMFGDLENTVRKEARQAVTEFIASKLPAWKIKGMSSKVFEDNIVWVAVDIEKDGKGGVLNLAVRKFFPESGEPYWKAFLLDNTLKQQLHAMADAELWKKLNDAKQELEDLQNPPDSEDREPPDPR